MSSKNPNKNIEEILRGCCDRQTNESAQNLKIINDNMDLSKRLLSAIQGGQGPISGPDFFKRVQEYCQGKDTQLLIKIVTETAYYDEKYPENVRDKLQGVLESDISEKRKNQIDSALDVLPSKTECNIKGAI